MYYTPGLFRMHKRDTPICQKCSTHPGDFLHMVLDCDRVRPFWSHITAFMSSTFDLPNICNPIWCLMGVFEDLDLSATQKHFLQILLYYYRKIVALQWIHTESLHITIWKRVIIQNMPLYKLTYEARGCPKKVL